MSSLNSIMHFSCVSKAGSIAFIPRSPSSWNWNSKFNKTSQNFNGIESCWLISWLPSIQTRVNLRMRRISDIIEVFPRFIAEQQSLPIICKNLWVRFLLIGAVHCNLWQHTKVTSTSVSKWVEDQKQILKAPCFSWSNISFTWVLCYKPCCFSFLVLFPKVQKVLNSWLITHSKAADFFSSKPSWESSWIHKS